MRNEKTDRFSINNVGFKKGNSKQIKKKLCKLPLAFAKTIHKLYINYYFLEIFNFLL